MPRREYDFWVYILASRSHQLYVGMTNSLERRMEEHRAAPPDTHTARYNINRLVYFEHSQYVLNAIAREKELKDFSHSEKVTLIERINPTWIDLSADFGHSLRAFWRTLRLVEESNRRSPPGMTNKEATTRARTRTRPSSLQTHLPASRAHG